MLGAGCQVLGARSDAILGSSRRGDRLPIHHITPISTETCSIETLEVSFQRKRGFQHVRSEARQCCSGTGVAHYQCDSLSRERRVSSFNAFAVTFVLYLTLDPSTLTLPLFTTSISATKRLAVEG